MQATLLALTLIATGTTAEPTADSIAAQATAPLTFNVSFLNIYDSQPGVGENGNDLKLVLGLGYTF